MDFKVKHLNQILGASLFVVLLIGLFIWKSSSAAQDEVVKEPIIKPMQNSPEVSELLQDPVPDVLKEDGAAIQQQLDRDRQDQKQTKYLKNKLEQTNLELEQEKAIAEINKLKTEDGGVFKDPLDGNQKNLPDIKVEYIGGDSIKKEAILSIAGSSYQVKERSSPIDNMEVLSISDSSVTVHFSGPQALTKTIEYKPE